MPGSSAKLEMHDWSGRQDSNLRPSVPKTDALPGCATPRTEAALSLWPLCGASEIDLSVTIASALRAQSEASIFKLIPALFGLTPKFGGPGGIRTPNQAVMSGRLYH